MTLLFSNPEMKSGLNVTVRRGVKWSLKVEPGAVIDYADVSSPESLLGKIRVVNVRVMGFWDLVVRDILDEHDKKCRDYDQLLRLMKAVYHGFDERETVTIITFEREE